MSIAINQLPTLLTSTLIFLFIILLILMSIKLMQTYRTKYLHILFIGGLSLAGVQQILLLLNFQAHLSLSTYIISTTAGMLSFIILNYVLMKLSISNGKVKSLPYFLFSIIVIATGIFSFVISPDQAYIGFNSYGTPIQELAFVIILIILMTQVKVLHNFAYYFMAMAMLLVNILAHLFHYYLIGFFTMWLHITELLSYIVYFIFIFLLLFTIVTEKMRRTYLTSISDHMTGLYLRQNFIKRITKLFQVKPIAIIFCDIDNFKQLNDTKGHLEADQVLIKVANIIKQETLDYGYAGRYGGEEIVAGIDTTAIKAEDVAEKIRKRTAEETEVTISIGISVTKDSQHLDELLKFADDAMYFSKTTGKNKVTMYKSLPASFKKNK